MMGNTRVCRSFTLVVKETSLSFHMVFSLPKELNALAILIQMLALLELFSAMQEPKYVNSVTCSRLFPYSLMLRVLCSLLMHIVCVFHPRVCHTSLQATWLNKLWVVVKTPLLPHPLQGENSNNNKNDF